MKKFLIIYAMVATLLLIIAITIISLKEEKIVRLNNNYEALLSEVKLYRNRLKESTASAMALQLEIDEYREQRKRDIKHIRALGTQLRRVESVAKSATATEVSFRAPLYDTIIVYDTVWLFRWRDKWVSAEGAVRGGEVECKIESVDTLRQVIHRVPRRFGLIRYGTKGIRQEVSSSNPHTKVVYTEYIELPKRRKKRKK